jgi:hypothetical protein
MAKATAQTLLALGQLVETGQLTDEMLRDLLAKTANPILTLLHADVEIGSTCGWETIAKADEVFAGYLDADFTNWGTDKRGVATGVARVKVYEMDPEKRDSATFAEMFGSLGDLDHLVLSQGQNIWFCEHRRDLLRADGYGTFFLFKVGDEYFVADVRVGGRELEAGVSRLDYDGRWPAGYRHRLVVPQQ